jgi:hypothetical protein
MDEIEELVIGSRQWPDTRTDWLTDGCKITLTLVRTFVWKFSKCTLVCNLHTAFNLLYAYEYAIKLCRQQMKAIQNYENGYVCSMGRGEFRHRKYKKLKLGSSQAY